MVGHQISIPGTSSYLLFYLQHFRKTYDTISLSPSSTPINSLRPCLVNGFFIGFWLFNLVKQPKKVFGYWLFGWLKSWLLSQNEKAAWSSFLDWLLACWPTNSLINSQQPTATLNFAKHFCKQLA